MRAACAAARGPRRSLLEDRALWDPALGLLAVFDGAGGVVSGAVAAPVALSALQLGLWAQPPPAAPEAWDRGAGLGAALAAAHRAVAQAEASEGRAAEGDLLLWAALEEPARDLIRQAQAGRLWLKGMFSTVAALWVGPGGRAALGHVGDCRAYLLRAGALELLTRDHSLENELGAEALPKPVPQVVTRALGVGASQAEVRALTLEPGDRVLLCTDGVWRPLAGPAEAELGRLAAGPLEEAPAALLARAHAEGGDDGAVALLAAD